jgi:integrase
MATVEPYKLTSGKRRYRVRYRTPDNRSTDKSGFTTKKAAQDYAATVEVSKLRGEYVAPAAGRVTIGVLGVARLGRQSHLKPSSVRAGEIAWRVHVAPHWAEVSVTEVRRSDVAQWVADLSARRGAASVQRAFGCLASILDDAVADRRITSNPARGVKLPRKVRRQHTYLSHAQVWSLAEAAGDNAALVLLLSYAGLRFGEAAGLQVADCDLLRRRVAVNRNATEVGSEVIVGTPKSHRRRTVPVPRFLVAALAGQCEGKSRDDLLFPGPNGYLRPSHSTTGWFEAARVRAGLPRLTPHDLRHSAASLAVSAGANVKAVQRMLGHASAAETLDTYADLFDDDLEAVSAALDDAVAAANCGCSVGFPGVGGRA